MAQDGDIATTTCQHGIAESECLICKTLSGRTNAPAVQPDVVYQGSNPPAAQHKGSIGLHLTLVVAGIAVIGLVAWLVAGVVFALFHVLELVLVAGLAGWGGYRLGRFRGRRMK